MGIEIKVAANGRMVLPADVRKRLGLENGGKLMLNEGEFGLELTNFRQRLKRTQALYKKLSEGKKTTSVDEFLAEKRANAALEKY
jgi:AbrB family looped-hinge helix DNA binding protein